MGLKEVLGKMKLVEIEDQQPRPPHAPSPPPPPPSAPARTRAASAPAKPAMSEILHRLPAQPALDEQALGKAAADEIPDFEAIYRASGVKDPGHGFGAYKVLEILSSPDFAGLDVRAKAVALSGFLKMNPSGPVPIGDVIQDAVARDRALDGFEQFLSKKLDARGAEIAKRNTALQAEIDELTRRNQDNMEANRRSLEQERQRFSEWQARKRIEERKLFDAVGPFVEQNPVSLGGATEAPQAPGGGPAKG